MGEVFLARDPLLDREVAVKTILSDRAISQDTQERFLREAKTAGALSHPNLVTVHEFGVDAGTRFIVMEYLPGQDLRSFLALRSLTPAEVLEVLAQVCDGLAHAHSRKVLHRDIKPSNVRVWRDGGNLHAKVMDFGLARLPDSDLTATGAVMGTFAYMAPESLSGGQSDERSDTYAVGVILYEALMGVRPMLALTLPQMAPDHGVRAMPSLPAGALQGISSRTWEIVQKALALDPAQRFQTARELAVAIRGAQDPAWYGLETGNTQTVSVHPPGSPFPRGGLRRPSTSSSGPVRIPNLWITSAPAPARSLDGWTASLLMVCGALGLSWWATRSKTPPPVTPAAVPAAQAPSTLAQSPSPPAPFRAQSPNLDAGITAVPQPQFSRPEESRPFDPPPRPARTPPQALAGAAPGTFEPTARILADLYHQGRYEALPAAFAKARSEGLGFDQLNQVAVFRDFMLEEERQHKIPPLVRRELEPYLPPPREGPPPNRKPLDPH